jgi:hypothetical protein
MVGRWGSLVLVGALLAETGCYDWVAVSPADASKLSGSFAEPVGSAGQGNVVAVRVVDVHRPDGRLVELSGKYDIRVTDKDGQIYDFVHPISVESDGTRLTFSGGNRAPLDLESDDVAKLEVLKLNKGATGAAIAISALLAVGLIVGLTFLALPKTPSGTSY